ncbi:uncharacterized protein LOC135837295 [Planococcus citri]|uniref:uncharacterized protein LOC135837295 n=1 Tax=Planococcus citri TaxID=170843 RepID=UPI0031FA4068
MNYQNKLTFLILLVLKVILSTQNDLPPRKYDIIPSLGNWITNIIETVDSSIKDAYASVVRHKILELEYNITQNVNLPFQSKIIFYDITFYVHKTDAAESTPLKLSKNKLSDNQIRLSTPHFRITLEGELRTVKNQSYTSYFTTLHFQDFVLDVTPKPDDPSGSKFSFEFSYKSYRTVHHVTQEEITWPKGDLTENQKTELTRLIKPILPLLLREHMNRNPELSKAFDHIIKIYTIASNIISTQMDFFEHHQQYYYLIPQIHFYGFYLRDIVVQGVLNIDSLNIEANGDLSWSPVSYTQTLLMKNIVGNITLDYCSENHSPLKLKYQINYLAITTKKGSDLVQVEARGYNISRTTGAPLTTRQSANIICKIECAIAAALMTSKKAQKSCDIVGQIDITNSSDWKMIERKYSQWIPFNEFNNITSTRTSASTRVDSTLPVTRVNSTKEKPWFEQGISYDTNGFFMWQR